MEQSFKILHGLCELTSRSGGYLARLMALLCLLELVPTTLGICLEQLAKFLLGLLMTVLCLLEPVPTALSVCIGQLIQILLGLVLWIMDSHSGNYLATLMAIFCLLGCVPTALGATLEQSSFPDISFQLFSTFVEDNFNKKISLATVLTMLFTLTNNPDLLNLHARQQQQVFKEERSHQISGWIKMLAYALEKKLEKSANELFSKSEQKSQLSDDQTINAIGEKLDDMSKLLKMYPYDKYGNFQQKLKPVSEKTIEPAFVICPPVMECETSTCNPRSLLQNTDNRDIPKVTFIQGTKIYDHAFVLSGRCPQCKTKYYADHESCLQPGSSNTWSRFYLNSAKYLKIGQQLWVDRTFSKAVLNGAYSFHGSSSAFAEFWSDSFWATQVTSSKKVTRRQIWQALIQESIRKIADSSGHTLELPDGLNITQVTKQAFAILGGDGIIGSANGHSCSGCTQPFKKVADKITDEDPAALLGVDENNVVPPLTGEDADLAVRDAALARFNANNAMNVDEEEETLKAPRTMVVMDGIVVGPPHCAYADCTAELANSRQGVFCIEHELMHGGLCRMRDCQNPKADDSHVCIQHQGRWCGFLLRYGRQSMLGIRRIIRRTEEEKLPWLPNREPHAHQAHDEPGHGQERQHDSYFKAPRFYCVETLCAPCGVVIAWTKFAKAESPTNILGWLDSVYPNAAQRPDYVCIDKACLVLHTAVVNGSWEVWSKTTRFIVDSYHYINHHTTDYLCRTWCNPAPLNGSQPNLIAVEYDAQGQPHYKRAFNTQVGCLFHRIRLTANIRNRHVNS